MSRLGALKLKSGVVVLLLLLVAGVVVVVGGGVTSLRVFRVRSSAAILNVRVLA